MMKNFKELSAFQKEFKKLFKKYKSLNSDLLEFKKVIAKFPAGRGRHFTPIVKTETLVIIKARFFCRYLRGSSLRIIYAYCEKESSIEFIEIYFKGNKGNEDKNRIMEYLKNSS